MVPPPLHGSRGTVPVLRRHRRRGDPDGDFHPSPTDTLAIADPPWNRIAGWRPTLRWILVHMIEEYARHCGHADLLREAVDGATGD